MAIWQDLVDDDGFTAGTRASADSSRACVNHRRPRHVWRPRPRPAKKRRDGCGDDLAVDLAGARAGSPSRRRGGGHRRLDDRFCPEVGGHLGWKNCRVCRPFARTAAPTHRNPGRAQVRAGRNAMDDGSRCDPAQCPTQAPECSDVVLLLLVQDIAHPARDHAALACVNVSAVTS
jgi:hypothetical protein